jgi:hypothetical protein
MSNFREIRAAILFVLIFSFLSGGCSKDENPIEAKSDPLLAGVWKVTKMSSEYQGMTETLTENQLDSMGTVWTFIIEDDGNILKLNWEIPAGTKFTAEFIKQ